MWDMGTAAVLERPVLIAHPSSYVAMARNTQALPNSRQEKWDTAALGVLERFRNLFRGQTQFSLPPKFLDVGKALNLQMPQFLISLCGRPGTPWNPLDQARPEVPADSVGDVRGSGLGPTPP